MNTKPDTFRALIETLGGVNAFARQMNLTPFAAKKMRDRNSVGSDHWAQLIAVANSHGIAFTTQDFVAMSRLRTVEKRKRTVAA